ncbi:NAD dependent epimerase/dehydratase family protein [Cucurbitaria berberidis CBS 394.84]|uniref:NAD dependent epimerase/dehydratase family protein n=1 Tax=Cucurbitaria berberidis CBS 394.84 TaxID=1168544 RepID=A0A9P4LCA9_9PLEO|nr:NAD dependent epimerase/dehydratase family protein [Cucurbitaria berberidis CBS 394.84]KAF1850521.1 NAD dependent epimerase/dehydratase family protein [Cucurbitaria berberidis CBS 394.84]
MKYKASRSILITGATGYLGGGFLAEVLTSNNSILLSATYSVLLRSSSQASLFTNLDVTPLVLQNTEDLTELRHIASNYDIIVNFAYNVMPEHAKALVLGLGDRKLANPDLRTPVIIQASSGTSNFADRPFSAPDRFKKLGIPLEFTDLDSNALYEIEKRLDAEEPYPLRTTDLNVIDTALEVGVKTHVVMLPTVYGTGAGPGNKISIQIPVFIKSVLKHGYLAVAGEGNGVWDRVHIQDLVALFKILISRILQDEDVPSGKDGLLFSGTVRNSWNELAHAIINVGLKLGKIPADTEVKHVDLTEAEKAWGLDGFPGLAELAFASNSRTYAERATQWGWEAKVLDMESDIEADWLAVTKDA